MDCIAIGVAAANGGSSGGGSYDDTEIKKDIEQIETDILSIEEDLSDIQSYFENVKNLAGDVVQGFGLRGSGTNITLDPSTDKCGYIVEVEPNTQYSVIYTFGDATYFRCVTFTNPKSQIEEYYHNQYQTQANGSVILVNTNTNINYRTFTTGENDHTLIVFGNRSTIEKTQVLEGTYTEFQDEKVYPSDRLDVYNKAEVDTVINNKVSNKANSLVPYCYGDIDPLVSFDKTNGKLVNFYEFSICVGKQTDLNNYLIRIKPFEIAVSRYDIVYIRCDEIPSDGIIESSIIRTKPYYSSVSMYDLKTDIPLFSVCNDTVFSTFGVDVKDCNRMVWFGDSISMLRTVPHDVARIIGAAVTDVSIAGSVLYKNTTDNAPYEKLGFYGLTNAIVNGEWGEQDTAIENMSTGAVANYSALKSVDFSKIDTVVCLYGTNDYNASVVTIEEFKNGMSNAITRLLTAYPNIKMYFISPLYRGNGETNNSQGKKLYDYVLAEKEVCERFNIPFYDLYKNSGINALTKGYYLVSDELHVNEKGNKLLADKCSAFLKAN